MSLDRIPESYLDHICVQIREQRAGIWTGSIVCNLNDPNTLKKVHVDFERRLALQRHKDLLD